MTPIECTRAFYAAVADGDVPGVVALLHPERLQWTEAEGFPYFSGTWSKPMDVVEKLLVPLMADWARFAATPSEFLETADGRVVTLGTYSGVCKATGKAMRAPFAHIWQGADGYLVRFDMYTDTLLIARAMA